MKSENNYIPQEEMLQIARDAGCEVEEQKSYFKIQKPGVKDQLIYIAKTDKVARVDLSGFELKEPGVARYLGGEKFGRVHYQLRFDLPIDIVKIHFKKLCEGLGRWVPLAKSKRGRPVGLKGSKKDPSQGVVVIQAELTTEQMIDKLVSERETKRALAQKMGSSLSKKTELEYEKKLEELRKQI
jgi:hypothetical protein